jgi:hypothetical protein
VKLKEDEEQRTGKGTGRTKEKEEEVNNNDNHLFICMTTRRLIKKQLATTEWSKQITKR